MTTIRTGVTVIVPHQGNVFQDKVPGAVFVGNAFGKLAGSTQVDELGTIETPIGLTNTLSVGAVMEGLVRWTLDQSGNDNVRSVNALVGETNDGGLNDIRGQHVRPQHVIDAVKAANTGAVQEGSVGAGTGTQAFGWKGGIGTSSRRLDARYGGYTVGVLVQSNYGGVLTMGGAPVGKILGRYSYRPTGQQANGPAGKDDHGDGSCMIVVATDAPLDARDLEAARRARRVRPGAHRLVVQQRQRRFRDRVLDGRRICARASDRRAAQPRTLLPTDGVSPLFQAALEATEEAVYNSLLKATPVTQPLRQSRSFTYRSRQRDSWALSEDQ